MGKFDKIFTINGEVPQNSVETPQPQEVVIEEVPTVTETHVAESGDKWETNEINVIELKDITLKFGDYTLFNKLNLTIPDFKNRGQFITILGGSGSGKSCIARLITNLESPTSGERKLYGKPYDDKTHIPMVFQSYSSYPWASVEENIALPMKLKGIDEETIQNYTSRLIDAVGLRGHEKKYAQTPPLSGGQLQRVALARALATNSPIIVLDEFSSGLDLNTKTAMDEMLYKIYCDKEVDRTFILITHDISEALFLSQRIFVLSSKTHTFSKIIDIDYNVDYRNRNEIISHPKYKEYYNQIEEALAE